MSPLFMASEPNEIHEHIDLHDRHYGFWREKHEAMVELEDFYRGERYTYDNDEYNRDRRLIQIRGPELQDGIRHVVAQATARPISIHAKPKDKDLDPQNAEVAAQLLQAELTDPYKGFPDEEELAIFNCRMKRTGIVWMDWDPECGEFGELLYSEESAEHFMWDPAYFRDPHHPKCGWLIRKRRIHYKRANEMYGVDWIVPDKMEKTKKSSRPEKPIDVRERGKSQDYDDERASIWEFWYKNDKTIETKETGERELEPDEKYMACKRLDGSGCGWRSETQGALMEQGKLGPEGLPEMEDECPMCMDRFNAGEIGLADKGYQERIELKVQEADVLKYAEGKRLVVIAPNCQHSNPPLYDDAWPIPGARSYPGEFITCYIDGQSDTDIYWDQQQASDVMRTHALQMVLEHRSYWVLPADGIVGHDNKRFVFRDDQRNVMYKDMTKTRFGPLDVQKIDGSGLDPMYPVVFGAIQQALTQYRGISDIGVTPEQTQQQSGVAIAERHQIGEIPTAHFNRRKNRARGKFAGVVWDYIRGTYTPARLEALNLEGVDLAGLSGDELANFDFTIEDTPEFTGLEEGKAKATEWIMNVITNPDLVPFFDLLAEGNSIPEPMIAKYAQRLEARQQAMQEAQAAAAEQQAAMDAMMGGGVGDEDVAPEGVPPSPSGVPPEAIPQEVTA